MPCRIPGAGLPGALSERLAPHQPAWIQVVLADLVPVEVPIVALDFGASFPREGGSRPNEIVASGGGSEDVLRLIDTTVSVRGDTQMSRALPVLGTCPVTRQRHAR